jgi:hypothetical protein
MAPAGRRRLLPLPRGPGQPGPFASVSTSLAAAVAAGLNPPQSTREGVVAAAEPAARPLKSDPPSSASLSGSTLRRQTSKVRAVCVNALVRICAGGDQHPYRDTNRRNSSRAVKQSFRDRQCLVSPLYVHLSGPLHARERFLNAGRLSTGTLF